MRFTQTNDRYRLRMRSIVALIAAAMTILPMAPAFAELSEAEKQTLEAEKKAAELEAEGAQGQETQQQPEAQPPEAPEPAPAQELTEAEKKAAEPEAEGAQGQETQQQPEAQPPEAPEPAPAQELTEAEKRAIEAAMKAAESGGAPDDGQQGGGTAKASMRGTIGAIGTDSITVGIFPDSTFGVDGSTSITFNGQISNLIRLHIGDQISVQYDPRTFVATSIEAEGMIWGAAIYTDVSVVTCVGLIGHIPGRSLGFLTANGAGVKIGTGTQVTVNGVPATYMDIQVGDTVDYVQNALDLKAHTVKVTR